MAGCRRKHAEIPSPKGRWLHRVVRPAIPQLSRLFRERAPFPGTA